MIDDLTIFCSGNMNISYEVIRKFKGDSNKSVTSLQSIAKNTYESMCALSESPSLEIIVLYNSNEKIHQIQMAHYTSFEQKYTTVSEGIGLYSGGIHTETSLEKLTDIILKSDVVDVKKVFTQLYEEISCEEIGGNLKILEVGNVTKEIYDDTINDRDDIRRLDVGFNPHLVIAEMVLGKILLGQKVVIGDTSGVFTIEGSKLMIDDRCGRPVLRLGLTSEQPDVFGLHVNRYASSNCNNTTITNVSGMDNSRGFYIDKIRNGVTSNVLGLSLDGNFRLRVGDDNQVIVINEFGLGIGSDIWQNSPFRVDYMGNMWAKNAFIEKSTIKDSDLIGNRLTLRDGGNVMKLWPTLGFFAGKESEEDTFPEGAPMWIKMDGTAIFKKLVVTDKNNTLLIDSEKKYIDFGGFDAIGIGALDAELIAANMLTAQDGIISNLTAGKLSTLTNAAIQGWSDYVRIEGNSVKWITGRVTGVGSQKQLSDGRKLYWTTSEQMGLMTVEETAWPVMVYNMEEKIKRETTFEGSGDAAQPVEKIGTGDGGANDRAKMVNTKYNGGYKQEYKASNTARERSIDYKDDGVYIISAESNVQIASKEFNIIADGGNVKIALPNGTTFEMTSTGDINAKASRNMNFEASGIMNLKASRINLN